MKNRYLITFVHEDCSIASTIINSYSFDEAYLNFRVNFPDNDILQIKIKSDNLVSVRYESNDEY